jgi:hypothetical protein
MSSSEQPVAEKQSLQYADEVLCASWNPLALLVAEPASAKPAPSVDGNDAEAFLARLYRCQQA